MKLAKSSFLRDSFNFLSEDISEETKMKAFPDDKIDIALMVFDRVENSLGKGENAAYQHFFSFSYNVFISQLPKGRYNCTINNFYLKCQLR